MLCAAANRSPSLGLLVLREREQVQRPDIANPPTLLLAVMELVNQYRASNSGSHHTNGPELKFFRCVVQASALPPCLPG